MFRTLALSTLALLTVDGVTTVLAPATGISMTNHADAAFIRRGKVKHKRTGGYKVVVKVEDEGDASTADVASLSMTICEGDVCSDPIELGSDGYAGVFKSSRFAYDGAEVPEGKFKLESTFIHSDETLLKVSQSWQATAEDGEITLTPTAEVDSKTYISELILSSDDCGNGKAKAIIEGDNADLVASFEIVDVEGTLFSKEDVDSCDDGACVTGSLKKGKASYTESGVDLGKLGELMQASEDGKVTISFTAYNSDGKELGNTDYDGVRKYGDILIDGVPLEFD